MIGERCADFILNRSRGRDLESMQQDAGAEYTMKP
jgi:hypothetical protein